MERIPPTMKCIDHSQPAQLGAVSVDADLRPLIFALQSIRAAIEERDKVNTGTEPAINEKPPTPVINVAAPEWPDMPADLKPTVHVHVEPADSAPVVAVNPPSVALTAVLPVWVGVALVVQSVAVLAALVAILLK